MNGKSFFLANGTLATGSAIIPEPATELPLGPGTAKIGESDKYALEDHIHPLIPTPLQTKTYTNVIATANDNNGGGFFYLKVRSNTFSDLWHVKVRVIATVPSDVNYYTDTFFDAYGFKNGICAYECLNHIKSTSYRPIYYNSIFFASETGYNNSCGNWIGFNLYNSTNPTSSSYKRMSAKYQYRTSWCC